MQIEKGINIVPSGIVFNGSIIYHNYAEFLREEEMTGRKNNLTVILLPWGTMLSCRRQRLIIVSVPWGFYLKEDMIKRLVIKDCLDRRACAHSRKLNVISGGNERKTSILETIEKALFNTKRQCEIRQDRRDRAYIELETTTESTSAGMLRRMTLLDSGSSR